MINILYLSYDGLTDPLGQSQVLPYITGLSGLGYRFTIISFEKQANYSANVDTVRDICAAHHIHWMPLSYTKTPPVLSTLKDLYSLQKAVGRLHRKKNFTIIHCRSYLTALIGLWAKRKWNIKFVFDMRGFWADERVDGGLWRLENPLYRTIYRFFKQKEQQFFQQADYIVSLTDNARVEIESNISGGKKIAPVEVIPCCVDLDLFNYKINSAAQVTAKQEELHIPAETKVVSYIGSVGTWYMLEEMLRFFKQWLLQFPESVFLFITGDNPAEITTCAQVLDIPAAKIRIVKGRRDEMPLLIACCDYSLFFIKPLYSKKASSPTKQGEIMAMGKPVICNAGIGDTDRVINKYNAGIVIATFSADAYKEAIGKVAATQFDAEAIRYGAVSFYALASGVEKYQGIYKKITAHT